LEPALVGEVFVNKLIPNPPTLIALEPIILLLLLAKVGDCTCNGDNNKAKLLKSSVRGVRAVDSVDTGILKRLGVDGSEKTSALGDRDRLVQKSFLNHQHLNV
jgi:hypothetical protein